MVNWMLLLWQNYPVFFGGFYSSLSDLWYLLGICSAPWLVIISWTLTCTEPLESHCCMEEWHYCHCFRRAQAGRRYRWLGWELADLCLQKKWERQGKAISSLLASSWIGSRTAGSGTLWYATPVFKILVLSTTPQPCFPYPSSPQ